MFSVLSSLQESPISGLWHKFVGDKRGTSLFLHTSFLADALRELQFADRLKQVLLTIHLPKIKRHTVRVLEQKSATSKSPSVDFSAYLKFSEKKEGSFILYTARVVILFYLSGNVKYTVKCEIPGLSTTTAESVQWETIQPGKSRSQIYRNTVGVVDRILRRVPGMVVKEMMRMLKDK